jgi:hypothetical protein
MPRRKDFEIWYDEKTERYRFSVEYWGSYGANTLESIKEKRAQVKSAVARRLKEIEKQNAAYYKRLAAKEEQLKNTLKEAKHKSNASQYVKFKDLPQADRIKLLKMIWAGADELEIKQKFLVKASTIAALRTAEERKKYVCETVQKDETLPRIGECRIIVPSYAADVIGNDRLGYE